MTILATTEDLLKKLLNVQSACMKPVSPPPVTAVKGKTKTIYEYFARKYTIITKPPAVK